MYLSRRSWLLSVVACSPAALSLSRVLAVDDAPVKVALLESVFSGQDRSKVVEQIKPFAEIIQKDTGTKANFDVLSLAQAEGEFLTGKIQLVILSGLEYAWLHAKEKDVQALLVASIDAGATRTVFVVKQGDAAKDLKELQQASVAVPERTPFLSQFYVHRQLGQPMDKAFKLVKSGNVDDTLEEILDGKARGAMVTGAGMDVFAERKPGRAKRLRILHQSPDFPQAAVVYHRKHAETGALEKFKKALLGANEKPEGSRVLTLFKLKGFEEVPASYEKLVQETDKTFPRGKE